jgi:hypothetical protein
VSSEKSMISLPGCREAEKWVDEGFKEWHFELDFKKQRKERV